MYSISYHGCATSSTIPIGLHNKIHMRSTFSVYVFVCRYLVKHMDVATVGNSGNLILGINSVSDVGS